MSSNIRINKVCKHCNKVFVAKTTVTSFCSDQCAKNNYKKRKKEAKLNRAESDAQVELTQRQQQLFSTSLNSPITTTPELLSIGQLSDLIQLSERTLFRLIKDPGFPRIKVGRRLLFRKEAVLDYLTSKFGNHERQITRAEADEREDQLVY